MGELITLLMYGAIVAIIAFLLYLVIKKAIKDALREIKDEEKQ